MSGPWREIKETADDRSQQTYLKAKEHRVEQTMWTLVLYEAIYSLKCAICLQTCALSSISGTHTEDWAAGELPARLKKMGSEEESLASAMSDQQKYQFHRSVKYLLYIHTRTNWPVNILWILWRFSISTILHINPNKTKNKTDVIGGGMSE